MIDIYININICFIYDTYLYIKRKYAQFVKICEEAQNTTNKRHRNGSIDNNNNNNNSNKEDNDKTDEENKNDNNSDKNNHNNSILNTFKHLILLPIHRIGRYEVLIKEILSNTNEQHNDYQNLQQTLRDIIGINVLINDKMKEFSEREVVRKIANAIKGNTSLKLETPYRKFIKNGYLIKMGKTKPQRYLFFLFNDLLFYCKKVGDDDNNKRDKDKEKEKDNNNNINNRDKEKDKEDSKSSKSEDSKESQQQQQDRVINLRPSLTNKEDVSTLNKQASTIAHDYSDTSDLHHITSLFGPRGKSRKSRTKLFGDTSSQSEGEDELSMTSFGMNVDIHNEIDVFNLKQLPQLKIHNYLPIDMAFDVKDFRIFPQRYDNKAFEIRSTVKSFVVVAENDRAKKEWMSLLEHCTNQLFQLTLTNKASHKILQTSGSINVNKNGCATPQSVTKMKKFAATLYLPTNFTEECMKCTKPFGYSRRKNHCHHCGWLVCSKCLTEKLPSFDTIRSNALYNNGNNNGKNNGNNKSKNNQTSKVCDDC